MNPTILLCTSFTGIFMFLIMDWNNMFTNFLSTVSINSTFPLGVITKFHPLYTVLKVTANAIYRAEIATGKMKTAIFQRDRVARRHIPSRLTSIARRITENGTHSSSPSAHQDSQLTMAHKPWAPSGKWSTMYSEAESIWKAKVKGYIECY